MSKYKETYAVDINGRLVTCTNGLVSAEPDLLRAIRINVALDRQLRLIEPYGELFTASLDPNDRMGTIAALMSPMPGRARVIEAPEEVLHYFATHHNEEDWNTEETK